MKSRFLKVSSRAWNCSVLSWSTESRVWYSACSRLCSEKNMAHVRNYRRVLFDEIIERRLPWVFKDRSNPLEELNEREVFIRYRFRPATIMFILASLQNVTQLTLRSFSLPPLLQLLVCLRFFATGSFQIVIGDTVNISRSTAGKCIRNVARSIANIIDQFIQFLSLSSLCWACSEETTSTFFTPLVWCCRGFKPATSSLKGEHHSDHWATVAVEINKWTIFFYITSALRPLADYFCA